METAPRALTIATRLLESEDWKFSTRLEIGREVTVFGTPDWCDETFGSVVIDWELDFELREWGVKEFNIIIRKVEAAIDLNDETGMREHIDINWPQADRPPGDIENPTAALARHMAVPQWNVVWTRAPEHTNIAVDEVTIDLRKHIVEIEF